MADIGNASLGCVGWTIFIVVAVIVIGALIVFSPLATISALNCLFGTNIQFNFWTWLSMFWLSWILYGGRAFAYWRKEVKK